MKHSDKFLRDIYLKQSIKRAAEYYDTNVEVMEMYCHKYMNSAKLSAPARFLPNTVAYQNISEHIDELEQVHKSITRVSKIKKLTKLINAKK